MVVGFGQPWDGKHGAAHALGDDDGLFIGGHLVAVALSERRVLVDEVLHEVLHVLGDFLQRVVAARPHLRSIAPRRRLLHVGAARVAVELALAGTAVAGGLVGVARHAGEHLQHAAVLDGVAVLVGGQLEVDAAVAVARIDARSSRPSRPPPPSQPGTPVISSTLSQVYWLVRSWKPSHTVRHW